MALDTILDTGFYSQKFIKNIVVIINAFFTVNFAFSYFYFLQNAVNLTSTLVRKASTADSKVNILVSFEKLEVFAMNYASLHLTPQNGSEREISIEQKELGIAFFVTILQIIFASSVCFLVCLFVF